MYVFIYVLLCLHIVLTCIFYFSNIIVYIRVDVINDPLNITRYT